MFDLLMIAGQEVMSEPLKSRCELLHRRVLSKLPEPIRESPVLEASLLDLIQSVKAHGLEGLVAKRIDSRYEPGQRSGAWQKMRVNQGQEFVMGGYTLEVRDDAGSSNNAERYGPARPCPMPACGGGIRRAPISPQDGE